MEGPVIAMSDASNPNISDIRFSIVKKVTGEKNSTLNL